MPRLEDDRLLRGHGRYADDLAMPGMLEAAFLRSPQAHARIQAIDATEARALPGVQAVYTASDVAWLTPLSNSEELRVPPGLAEAIDPMMRETPIPLLATSTVNYVGQPVAMVLAENRYLAEDALELVDVDYEPLPVLTDPEQALAPEAPRVHEDWEDNRALAVRTTVGEPERAFATAAVVIEEEFHSHRYVASPIETRGITAAPEPFTGGLTVWAGTQTPHRLRDHVAGSLGVPASEIRVLATDVGGGFGQKGVLYIEDLLIPFAARQTNRPVRWREDRGENLTASSHAREQTHRIALATDAEGHLVGLRDDILVNFGAYNATGLVVPYNSLCHLLGPYRVPSAAIGVTGVLTNTMFTSPYRGAGRPEAVFAMERALDRVAARLDLEPAELRARNLIPPEELPYRTGLLDRAGEPQVYDSGDFPELLRRAVSMIELDAVRRRQHASGNGPHRLGVGFATYLEATGLGPFESSRIEVLPSGRVRAALGAPSQGQGHRTSFAQITADALGVPMTDVDIVGGDTAAVPFGVGTLASRALVTAGNATHRAGKLVRGKILAAAGARLEIDPADLSITDGVVRANAPGGPSISLAELAGSAPLAGGTGATGAELSETVYYQPPGFTFASAAHAAVVDIDTATGEIRIEKYVVVHDSGSVVNPVIAEGQITGGVAQGIGGALYEEMIYDPDGQPSTASYLDYLVPTSGEIPDLVLDEVVTESPMNELGVKGLGEGGAIAPPAVLAGAVEDALRPDGVVVRRGPLSPDRLRGLVRDAAADAERQGTCSDGRVEAVLRGR
jgi:carbon-monoxide dehydrogenase large subunit